MKRSLLLVALSFLSCATIAQVGISNTDPKASLDITASNPASPVNTDGILIPRIDTFPSTPPGADQDGMLVFITGNGTQAEGFYYWDNGTTGWVAVSGSSSDSDWYEVGTSNPADNISDNIYHLGNIAVGGNNTSTTSPLLVQGDVNTDMANIITSVNGAYSSGTYIALSNSGVLTGAGNYTGISNSLAGSNDGTIQGVSNSFLNSGPGQKIGFENSFSSTDGVRKGFRNYFSTGSSISMGLENVAAGAFDIDNTFYGVKNDISAGGSGQRYGSHTVINSTGSGSKYGEWILINSAAGGQHYGVYSDVQKTSGYAGYFIGRTSFGTDPLTDRYLLPSADGTTGQMITTDGSGQLNFVDPVSEDIDWYEVGSTSAPNSINDDIFTQGFVAIGKNTADSSLDIVRNGTTSDPVILAIQDNSTGTGTHTGIQMGMGGSHNESVAGSATYINNSGTGLHTGSIISVSSGGGNQVGIRATTNGANGENSGLSTTVQNSGSASSFIQKGVDVRVSQPTSQISYGIFNSVNASGVNATGVKYGIYNLVAGGTANNHYGVYNDVRGTNNNTKYGTYNLFGIGTTNTSGVLYGTYNDFGSSITSSFDKYGTYTIIPSTLNGTHYGIYSDVQNVTGYSAYFIGRASFGNSLSNRYLMPASDGASGQMIATNGSGQLNFVNAPTDTDDQTVDTFAVVGNNLGISLEDDGQPVQTVDLSNVDFNVSNFALAKMNMSAGQTLSPPSWTKLDFDSAVFDLGSDFSVSTDRFDVSETGYYRITATIKSSNTNTTTSQFGVAVYLNGTAVKNDVYHHQGNGVVRRRVETIESLTAGQYIEIYAYAQTGISISNDPITTTFEVERIR
jgi:hypothetical protein